jgi:8-oxo-dGTP pyrophosphatase MutT (NUDIX family)
MQMPDAYSRRRALARDALVCLAHAAPSEDGQSDKPINLPMRNAADTAYLTALTDFLLMLGALECTAPAATVRITSFQVGYLIRLLIALLDTEAPLIADWTHQGVHPYTSHVFHSGVDLLHALEQRRLELAPQSPPLRVTTTAIGLIARRTCDGRQAFLLSWDAAASTWQFVGGKSEIGDASIRATMMRELAEELECAPLVEHVDVTLIELGPSFEEQRISPTVGLLTRTSFQAYAVRFIIPLPTLPATVRWIDDTYLLSGVTIYGQLFGAAT